MGSFGTSRRKFHTATHSFHKFTSPHNTTAAPPTSLGHGGIGADGEGDEGERLLIYRMKQVCTYSAGAIYVC